MRLFTCVVACLFAVRSTLAAVPSTLPATQPVSTQQLKEFGAFNFPQKQADVLCDNDDLRVSVWNDSKQIYLQAIIWKDSEPAGTHDIGDGRSYNDFSALSIDVDADGKATVGVDRIYYINALVGYSGLDYTVAAGGFGTTTPLQTDSSGRGSIRFLRRTDGPLVRVDMMVIPLDELKRSPGDSIRVAFHAISVNPDSTFNSVGLGATDSIFGIPMSSYKEIKLSDRQTEFDPMTVPDDRPSPGKGDRP